MFSTIRKLSTLCFILSAFNILVSLVLVVFVLRGYLSFPEQFSYCGFYITTSILFTCITGALRSACQDMQLEYDSTSEQLHALKKRVEALENK